MTDMLVLLDTNVVITHLRSGLLLNVGSETEFAVSVITEAELFRLAGISDEEETHVAFFLKYTKIFAVDSGIARMAARLGRTRKTGLPDLLIAATAITHGISLATKNRKDFSKIPELTFWDMK